VQERRCRCGLFADDVDGRRRDIMLRTTMLSLVLLLALLPVGMIEKTGASQSEKAWIVQALQEYVLKDKLDESIAHEVATGKPVEAFVVFEESDIQAEARKLRAASLVDEDTSEIVEHKARLFREKKHTVLSRLLPSDYEIIEDYQHFAITFVRFHTAEAIFQLLQDPDVLSIRENRMRRLQLEESLPLIRAPEAHALGARGSGTSVAVLDTGVDYTRPEFGSCSSPGSGCKVIHAQDFAPEDNSLDDDGHGTNVAAIVLGVAPDTRIISLDVFQVTREGRRALDNDILRAIDFVIENKDRYNIVAMNLSLGSGKFNSPCKSSVYRCAIVNAKFAGIATIAASGNNAFTDALNEPACVPEAISVGAVYDSATFSPLVCTLKRLGSTCVDILPAADKVTCFSNSASFLTLLAPGAAINAGGHTGCGTSQAAPHVAGAVAAIKSINPSLTPDQIKTILTDTGVAIRDERNNITKPRLNLYSATLNALKLRAAPTITASLTLAPAPPGPYFVGQTITAQFTITNRGGAPITFDVLTVGGRLIVNGQETCPDNVCPDFSFERNITLGPNESHQYRGTLTPSQPGTYHLFTAYRTPDGQWNTAIPADPGVTTTLNITVLASGDGSWASGFINPSGIAINPRRRELYVKSRTTGAVWSVGINPDGSAGQVKLVSDSFAPVLDVKFDAVGNLYGVTTDGFLWRLNPAGTVERTRLRGGRPIGTGIAIESPGVPTSRLYYVDEFTQLRFTTLEAFRANTDVTSEVNLGGTCAQFRFLLYRATRGDLIGTVDDQVISINPLTRECRILIGGLAQPNGLTIDPAANIYVADTGAGTIIKISPLGERELIASGLQSPTGLVFDRATGLLFVSETGAGAIRAIRVAEAPPPPPPSFAAGLANPTGVVLHPNQRRLYVKSGTSGRVWSVEINPDGSAGSVELVSDSFAPVMDVKFDAAGNLYGVTTDGFLWRLNPAGTVERTRLRGGRPIGTGIAIESPGVPTSRLYYVDEFTQLRFTTLEAFRANTDVTSEVNLGGTCAQFRFLLYRATRGDLIGTVDDQVISINPLTRECRILIGGLAQPNGLTIDPAANIYVADTGAGTIIKISPLGERELIASGLQSPTGLVFDRATGLLFVSETGAGAIRAIRVAEAPPPPPPSFAAGLANPTGVVLHPNQRRLYVKSGTSGRVWSVEINPDGSAGSVELVSDSFAPVMDVKFDAAGNLYGVTTDGFLWRLNPAGTVERTRLRGGRPIGTGIAIESPGVPTSRLYYVDEFTQLRFTTLEAFRANTDVTSEVNLGGTCAKFRFLVYRTTRQDLVGTFDDKVVSINLSNRQCTVLLGGLAQPNGLTTDPSGNIYVADTGAGRIVRITTFGEPEVIARGLRAPMGLAFDPVTGLLFVAEAEANRITSIMP
jgi:sugar lactone lactonase YvrE